MKKINFILFLIAVLLHFNNSIQASDLISNENENKLINEVAKNYFIENKNQLADSTGKPFAGIKFYGSTNGVYFYLKNKGISYSFNKIKPSNTKSKAKGHLHEEIPMDIEFRKVEMELVEANNNALIIKENPSEAYFNFYHKHCPDGIKDVRGYSDIVYKDIYPNIDMRVYHYEGNIKYDFIVHPGGNPNKIKMKFKGQDSIKIDKNGNLLTKTKFGTLTEESPYTFQTKSNKKEKVGSKFQVSNNVVSFKLENYDTTETLIIDPTRIWGTYFGGSKSDFPHRITHDKYNNIYITGHTFSKGIATAGAYDNILDSNSFWSFGALVEDVFIAKFNRNGTLQWATYYGGNEYDDAFGLTLDVYNNIYITGYTRSDYAIGTSGTYRPSIYNSTDNDDGFIAKFDNKGYRTWGTYFGGYRDEAGLGVALDKFNNIYVVGETISTADVATSGAHQTVLGAPTTTNNQFLYDVYLAKFNNKGNLIWATYYGGALEDKGTDIKISLDNNIYITGYTNSSTAISTTGAHQVDHAGTFGSTDAFTAKFNTSGTLLWATYLGGNEYDCGRGLITDKNNNIYVAGNCNSTSGIATSGTYMSTFPGTTSTSNGFLVKFNSAGVRQWGTYIGGTSNDTLQKLAISESTPYSIYVIGNSNSSGSITFTSNAFQSTISGLNDVILAEFNENGGLTYSTCYGGTQNDFGHCIDVDNEGYVLFTGGTSSTNTSNAIATTGAHQTTFTGTSGSTYDGFVAKFRLNPCPTNFEITTNTANCNSPTTNQLSVTNDPSYTYQWYKNGVAISGATTASYTPTTTGDYTVKITSSDCVKTSSAVTITIP